MSEAALDQGHRFEPVDVSALVAAMKARLNTGAHDHGGPDPCPVCGGIAPNPRRVGGGDAQ